MKKIPVRQLKTATQAPAPFSIRRIQDISGGDDLVHELHRHDFYFILLIQDGSGSHEIDLVPYKVTAGSVFILRPGQMHRLHLKAGSTGYLLEFAPAFYHPREKNAAQQFRKAVNKNFCRPHTDRFARLKALLQTIFDEHTKKEDGYNDIIRASLAVFFIEYIRQSNNPSEKPAAINTYAQERFEEFMELLQKNLVNNKQVSFYTKKMALSLFQLNQLTRAAVGKTAATLINEEVLLEAKRLLLATPHQVKAIADELGYEDASYFTRFFRKHTGLSPEAFRTQFI